MKRIFYLLMLLPFGLFGQNDFVRHIINADGEVTFWRGTQKLWVSSITCYHVKTGGNDALDGLTDATAWETIAKVNGSTFQPGDRILFNKGDTWIGRLNVPSSGSAINPIIFGNYGTGANPIIDADEGETRCISVSGKSYITINGIDCENATDIGIGGDNTGSHIIVQNLTISDIGTGDVEASGIAGLGGYSNVNHCTITNIAHYGIALTGGNNIFTYNDVSYTNASYDGWGAGIYITGTDDGSEISYNTIHDNGGVGLAGSTHGVYQDVGATNTLIHHNIVTNSSKGAGIKIDGSMDVYCNYVTNSLWAAFEVGFNAANAVTINIYNNITTENRQGVGQLSQGAGAFTLNIKNNTFYLDDNSTDSMDEIRLEDDINASLVIENNIIYANADRHAYYMPTQSHAVINNNCIYGPTGLAIYYNAAQRSWATWQSYGFDVNGVNADPLLVGGDPYDYSLDTGSTAINAGMNTGITTDYYGNPRVGNYDIGAIEKQ